MDSEKVEKNGKTYAIIIRKDIPRDNVKFYTSDDDPLQVGIHHKPKGTIIQPHVHKKVLRQLDITAEFFYLAEGKVIISVYDENKEKIKDVTLSEGDSILFTKGGHGFQLLEDSKIIEVKQGPYVNPDIDKEKF